MPDPTGLCSRRPPPLSPCNRRHHRTPPASAAAGRAPGKAEPTSLFSFLLLFFPGPISLKPDPIPLLRQPTAGHSPLACISSPRPKPQPPATQLDQSPLSRSHHLPAVPHCEPDPSSGPTTPSPLQSHHRSQEPPSPLQPPPPPSQPISGARSHGFSCLFPERAPHHLQPRLLSLLARNPNVNPKLRPPLCTATRRQPDLLPTPPSTPTPSHCVSTPLKISSSFSFIGPRLPCRSLAAHRSSIPNRSSPPQ